MRWHSKRSKTTFSTPKALGEHKSLKGKKIFHKVLGSLRGLQTDKNVINIPRNYKQICDVSQQSQSEEELIELLDICRGQEGTRNAFIRDVRTALEKNILPKAQSW